MSSYLEGDETFWGWIYTKDHKRIAILYLISITIFFFAGAVAATLFRLELLFPRGRFFTNDGYNNLFTVHGIMMVWFFLIPSIPAVLGNFVLPLMIGAPDLAFPRLNLASWYLFFLGGVLTLAASVFGNIDTGWTFYTPYSSTFSHPSIAFALLGILIAGFSSVFTGLNFIVTTHRLRAPGMTWFRLPLFVWAIYATSIILVIATPVLALVLLLVGVERLLGVGIFDPTLGGDPVLFQHLFWFYSHPAVYIMVLPAMGVVSEVITCFAKRQIFGYKLIAVSSLAIAGLGFLLWGHHMFVSGQSLYAGLAFSMLSFLIAIPSAIKVFNWTATLYKGQITLEAPMLYILGFIGLFIIGGLTGLFLASVSIDVQLHDTYFVVAHFHYIMVGGAVLTYFGGLHFWWPKMTGRIYPERPAQISAVLSFVGFNLTFFPQFILGFMGNPRRYHLYPEEFQWLHALSTGGAVILGIGYLLPFWYLLWSLKNGARAPANPWNAKGLEWTTSSPPPEHNFDSQPVVTEEAYAYP